MHSAIRKAIAGAILLASPTLFHPAKAQPAQAPSAPDTTGPDTTGIAALLDPLYAEAPSQDILGVRIGMTAHEALEVLVGEHGFTSEENWQITARGFGDMRALKLRRDAGERPAHEYVILYFDLSDRARVMAAFRDTDYVKGRNPKYYRVLYALDDKYGDTDLWDTRPNEGDTPQGLYFAGGRSLGGSWSSVDTLANSASPNRSNESNPAAIAGAPSSTKHPSTTRAPSRHASRPLSISIPTSATATTQRLTATPPSTRSPIHPTAASSAEAPAGSNRLL